MSINFLEIVAFALMGTALLFGMIRFLIGPKAPDRIVAADMLAIITTAGIAGLAVLLGNVLYLSVSLIYSVLSFVAMVALARAIEGGRS
ncbi:MAG: monovalent cation/H+ antiporter complex subunit F [Halieaceae bacterium]|jgi:multisubunit Na+/H+ antiporter MnhF subunit|nr:monovalent cation/H+ antiporter complex subunit F [Halieaceae bacterium]